MSVALISQRQELDQLVKKILTGTTSGATLVLIA